MVRPVTFGPYYVDTVYTLPTRPKVDGQELISQPNLFSQTEVLAQDTQYKKSTVYNAHLWWWLASRKFTEQKTHLMIDSHGICLTQAVNSFESQEKDRGFDPRVVRVR